MEQFFDKFGWHLIQILTLVLVYLVRTSFKHFLDEFVKLREKAEKLSEMVATEHDRFKEYVQETKCEAHRSLIERHIRESEDRISKMLSHCAKRFDDDLK